MSTLGRTLVTLVLIAVLFGALFGVYSGMSFAFQWITGLDSKVAAIGCLTLMALLAAAVMVSNGLRAGVRESERRNKQTTYALLLDACLALLSDATKNREHGFANADLIHAEKGLLLVGSAAVILRYLSFRDAEADTEERLAAFNLLLAAMRKDLRQTNFSRQEGQLLELLRLDRRR